MSISVRWMSSLIAALASSVLVLAQPATENSETVPNWGAPPYWGVPNVAVAGGNAEAGVAIQPLASDGVPTPALALTGITPCRVVDTRGNGFTGDYGPPALVPGSPRNFTLIGRCGIPGGAEAVSLNVTVTKTQGPGVIVIYPQGGAQPTASTLNYVGNQTIANGAVVPLGTGGGVTVVAGVSGTDLIIDVNGYYAPQAVVNTLNGFSGNVTLSAGANISIQTVGGPLFISATNVWSLNGNSVSPGQFLGSTNAQPLDFRVSNKRVLHIEPGTASPNLIGGFGGNASSANVTGGTIAGGGDVFFPNHVADDYATVGGGRGNLAGSEDGTTGSALFATVSGGEKNTAGGTNSTVGGGGNNVAGGHNATIAGGESNAAGGSWATVPGGILNSATGNYSFAAGRRAKATHAGAFVWGDSTDANVSSFATNSFAIRAAGGARFYSNASLTAGVGLAAGGGSWSNLSDAGLKENRRPVDGRAALERLAKIPIDTWNYVSQSPSIRHVGPTAQDFYAAFGVGEDDEHITTVDADGVALAAIQGLYEILQEKNDRIEALEARLAKLESKDH